LRLAGFRVVDVIAHLFGCLSEDTEILTDNGWKLYNTILDTDMVMCYNVDTDNYSYHRSEKKYVYEYQDTAYHIESDDTDQLVSKNHRCIVERDGRKVFRYAETLQRKEGVPFLESLSELPEAVYDTQSNASIEKQVMLSEVRGEVDFKSEKGEANKPSSDMRNLRERVLSKKQSGNIEGEVLFEGMLRGVEKSGRRNKRTAKKNILQRAGRMDGGKSQVLSGEHERFEQSGMEGRSYIQEPEGELQELQNKIREMPRRIYNNGKERRIRNGASLIGCATGGAFANKNGSGASQRPQSREQSIRQPDAIQEQQPTQEIRSSRNTRTTLATVTPIHYEGVMWCVKVPTGAFVARRNGKIFVTGNTGFPKSYDIGKGMDKQNRKIKYGLLDLQDKLNGKRIDKGYTLKDINIMFGVPENSGCAAHKFCDKSQPQFPTREQMKILDDVLELNGELWELYDEVEREVIGHKSAGLGSGDTYAFQDANNDANKNVPITAPATPEAKQWDGWGTALKPAREDWVLVYKPREGTYVENALKWGVAGLNIDGGRVPSNGDRRMCGETDKSGETSFVLGARIETRTTQGRWPANVTHDGSDEVLEGFPKSKGDNGNTEVSDDGNGWFESRGRGYRQRYSEGGSAARFFYCAKASRSERNAGLEGMEGKQIGAKGNGLARTCDICGASILDGCDCEGRTYSNPVRQNHHPTVKPIALMEYLVRLTKTPSGGIVLDPFAGSGTTGIACANEGREFVGYEQDKDYFKIAERRIEYWKNKPKQPGLL